MPIYMYRAVTKDGQIVSNKVEAFNKYILLKKIKDNGLLPIEVKPPAYIGRKNKINKQKKNIETSTSILKEVRIREFEKKRNQKKVNPLKKNVQIGAPKITKRDIVIFTQNFYLLKKANFNNVHALSTIIETTENPSLRTILEDILLGVEAGDYMYVTMEYYEGVFPPIYINMIKVGELSRFTCKCFRPSSSIFGRIYCNDKKNKKHISTKFNTIWSNIFIINFRNSIRSSNDSKCF